MIPSMHVTFIAAGVAFIVALAGTWMVRGLALRLGVVAAPRPDRWHRRPTALLGGIGLFAGVTVAFLLFAPGGAPHQQWALLGCAGLMFAIGLYDDLRPLKPHVKLAGQIVAATMLVFSGVVAPWSRSIVINDLATIFWLVGITNAINLLDNMDGLAAGIAAVSGLFLCISQAIAHQGFLLPALLTAACLGFLVFNFQPASIFMGDSGSMFLGFLLGGCALLSAYGRSRTVGSVLLAPVLLLMLPIADTTLVTLSRFWNGRRVSQGGRDHTSHRLVALGLSERASVLVLYAFAAACGTMAISARLLRTQLLLFLIPVFAVGVLLWGLHLGRVQVYAEGSTPAHASVAVLVDFSYKRRVVEVLLDLALMTAAFYGAFLLRFGGDPSGPELALFLRVLPVLLAVELAGFVLCGVYRGLWRYVSLPDGLVLGRAVVFSSLAATLASLLLAHGLRLSLAVMANNGLLLLVLTGGSRLSFRLLRAWLETLRDRGQALPVLVYGAGDAGERLLRRLMATPSGYCVVGLLDDDPQKEGRSLHGCRIYPAAQAAQFAGRFPSLTVFVPSAKVPDERLDPLRGLGLRVLRIPSDPLPLQPASPQLHGAGLASAEFRSSAGLRAR